MVFVVEADGRQLMYERATGRVYMFSHDHCFENVTFLPGQPAYTFHRINGVRYICGLRGDSGGAMDERDQVSLVAQRC